MIDVSTSLAHNRTSDKFARRSRERCSTALAASSCADCSRLLPIMPMADGSDERRDDGVITLPLRLDVIVLARPPSNQRPYVNTFSSRSASAKRPTERHHFWPSGERSTSFEGRTGLTVCLFIWRYHGNEVIIPENLRPQG